MNEVVLTLILFILILSFGCSTFVGGFFVARKLTQKAEPPKPSAPQLSEEEKLKKARTIAELKNFMNYTGDEQPEPESMLKL